MLRRAMKPSLETPISIQPVSRNEFATSAIASIHQRAADLADLCLANGADVNLQMSAAGDIHDHPAIAPFNY